MQRKAEVGMGLGQVGLDADGLAACGNGLATMPWSLNAKPRLQK
jgi:hypothetical protein